MKKLLFIAVVVLFASCKSNTEYEALRIKDSITLIKTETRYTDSLIKLTDTLIAYKKALIEEQNSHIEFLKMANANADKDLKFLQNLNK